MRLKLFKRISGCKSSRTQYPVPSTQYPSPNTHQQFLAISIRHVRLISMIRFKQLLERAFNG